MEDVKPCYPNKRGTSQVVRSTQLSSPTGSAKCKWYAPQLKICRDRLKWCGPHGYPPQIKAHAPWATTVYRASQPSKHSSSESSILSVYPSLFHEDHPLGSTF